MDNQEGAINNVTVGDVVARYCASGVVWANQGGKINDVTTGNVTTQQRRAIGVENNNQDGAITNVRVGNIKTQNDACGVVWANQGGMVNGVTVGNITSTRQSAAGVANDNQGGTISNVNVGDITAKINAVGVANHNQAGSIRNIEVGNMSAQNVFCIATYINNASIVSHISLGQIKADNDAYSISQSPVANAKISHIHIKGIEAENNIALTGDAQDALANMNNVNHICLDTSLADRLAVQGNSIVRLPERENMTHFREAFSEWELHDNRQRAENPWLWSLSGPKLTLNQTDLKELALHQVVIPYRHVMHSEYIAQGDNEIPTIDSVKQMSDELMRELCEYIHVEPDIFSGNVQTKLYRYALNRDTMAPSSIEETLSAIANIDGFPTKVSIADVRHNYFSRAINA